MITDVAAALAELFESGDDVERVILDTEPYQWEAERLYAYRVTDEYVGIESGPTAQQNFDIRLVYVTSSDGEEAHLERDPDIATFLDGKRHAYMEALRNRPQSEPYWTYARPIVEDGPETLENRSVAVRVTGYRIVS